MTALTIDDLKVLKGFFPANEHDFDYGKNAYIKEQSICNRIELVDPAWSLSEPQINWRVGLGGTAICEVTVVITINGVSRGGLGQKDVVANKSGSAEANQAAKSAATDALKRAARLFGIGRYLLDLPNSVKDVSSLSAWLQSQNTIVEMPTGGKFDPLSAKEFGIYWQTQGIPSDKLIAYLGVSRLGEWQGTIDSANELLSQKVG